MKTVIHLSSDKNRKISEMLGNVKNLKEDNTIESAEISVLMNSEGVKASLKKSDASDFMESFAEKGVEFKVCRNSIEGRDIDESELVNCVKIVPSGIGELNKLQNRGFNYIKI